MCRLKSTIIIAITSILLTGCSLFSQEKGNEIVFEPVQAENTNLIVDGILVPKQTSEIRSSVNEQIETVLVKEGDSVFQGDLLIRIKGRETIQAKISAAELALLQASTELETLNRLSLLELNRARFNLSQAELNLIEAQEDFKSFDSEDYQKKVDDNKVDLNDLEDDLSAANDILDDYKDLDEDNYLRVNAEKKVDDLEEKLKDSQRKLDRLIFEKESAQSALSTAEEAVSEARYQVQQKEGGADETKMVLLNAGINKAQFDIAAATKALNQVEIYAPYTGKILRVFVETGDTVMPGQQLITIADISQWYVETTDLTELDLAHVKIGEEIKMTADAKADHDFIGEVEKISEWYYEKGGDINYQVRILLTNPDPFLRWGMTFEVIFP